VRRASKTCKKRRTHTHAKSPVQAGREHLPDIVTDFWKGVYHLFTESFLVSLLRLGTPELYMRVDKALNV
jgi:hypothetical protein